MRLVNDAKVELWHLRDATRIGLRRYNEYGMTKVWRPSTRPDDPMRNAETAKRITDLCSKLGAMREDADPLAALTGTTGDVREQNCLAKAGRGYGKRSLMLQHRVPNSIREIVLVWE